MTAKIDRTDLRPYLMRRVKKSIHADLEMLAYMLSRGKESVARECLEIGIVELIRVNKIERAE